MTKRLWQISEYPFQPEKLRYFETIFTIGNGYLSTRATFEEGHQDDTPATLVHGIFNHKPGAAVPELAVAPNWLPLHIMVDGTAFSMKECAHNYLHPVGGVMLGYRRTLHMDTATLEREILFRAESGSTVRLVFKRFASLDQQHLIGQRISITAVDGTPTVHIAAELGLCSEHGGAGHWHDVTAAADSDQITLTAETSQSNYGIALASKLVVPGPTAASASENHASLTTTFQLEPDGRATIDKLTAIYSSRDVPDPLAAATAALRGAKIGTYDALYKQHCRRWQEVWESSDIQIKGDDKSQIALRFATYHILIAAPRYDNDVSIGARTLSGLGYKGHVFWDTELFALPPLTLTQPEIARNLLTYRYKRLAGARQKAQEYGCAGALFPWESTDTGFETTPKWSDLQPDGTRIRIWTGDTEQHICTDIAYAVLQYWRWTSDDEFLLDMGAEIVLDTAVFWGERVEAKNGRYEISTQIGPDEYHENIDNSVFTNRMVQWHLDQALTLLDWLQANAPDAASRLIESLDLSDTRRARWRDIVEGMYIPFDSERQIHVQFDGFFDLEYIPVLDYQPRVGGIWAFLGHKRALQSQVIKQADVVMLVALLGNKVGSREVLLNNFNTYYPRTDHGSSLSPAIHAWVAARLGLNEIAFEMFEQAAAIDLEDNRGNVADGIHAAACGGLWQAIVFGFCGLHLTDDGPKVDPKLPEHWQRVSFSVTYRGETHRFDVVSSAV